MLFHWFSKASEIKNHCVGKSLASAWLSRMGWNHVMTQQEFGDTIRH